MDDMDKALEILKFHIKKEIVDHYFGERVYLEEEVKLFQEELQEYRQALDRLAGKFHALYQALGPEEASLSIVLEAIGAISPPFHEDFTRLTQSARQSLLKNRRAWGLTARSRRRHLVFALWEELEKELRQVQEQYHQAFIHLKLLNEDIEKFNLSFDFGLIAAQIETLEGRGEVISGGLLAPEREELSTRMRFKRVKLTEADLPPPPTWPALKDCKDRLNEALNR